MTQTDQRRRVGRGDNSPVFIRIHASRDRRPTSSTTSTGICGALQGVARDASHHLNSGSRLRPFACSACATPSAKWTPDANGNTFPIASNRSAGSKISNANSLPPFLPQVKPPRQLICQNMYTMTEPSISSHCRGLSPLRNRCGPAYLCWMARVAGAILVRAGAECARLARA